MCSELIGDNEKNRMRVSPVSVGVPLGPLTTSLSLSRPVGQLGFASHARMLRKAAKRETVNLERLKLGAEPKILSGTSRLVLSSLRTEGGRDTGAVTLYADVTTAEGARVAVCLFGSATNVRDFTTEVPAWRRFGWTCSHLRGVTELLLAGANAEPSQSPDSAWWPDGQPTPEDTEELGAYAATICEGQGTYFDRGILPWRRGYTLGQFDNSEWLARIYYGAYGHVRTSDALFDAVLVGAPYWVRGALTSWSAYDADSIARLEANRFPKMLRPLIRLGHRRP